MKVKVWIIINLCFLSERGRFYFVRASEILSESMFFFNWAPEIFRSVWDMYNHKKTAPPNTPRPHPHPHPHQPAQTRSGCIVPEFSFLPLIWSGSTNWPFSGAPDALGHSRAGGVWLHYQGLLQVPLIKFMSYKFCYINRIIYCQMSPYLSFSVMTSGELKLL